MNPIATIQLFPNTEENGACPHCIDRKYLHGIDTNKVGLINQAPTR